MSGSQFSIRAVLMGAAAAALSAGAAQAQEEAVIRARVVTQAAASSEIVGGVIALDDRNPAESRIIAATARGGLEAHSLDGRRRAAVQAGQAAGIDITYNFNLGGAPTTLIAITDSANNTLSFYALRAGALSEVGAGRVDLGFAAENVCFYRHAQDGANYIFVLGEDGEVDQQRVYVNAEGRVAVRPVRRITTPSSLTQCAADSAAGVLYATEEEVGVWRFNADPEADVHAVLIDSHRFGQLQGEIEGMALYDGGAGARWLLVADTEGGRILVYDRGNDDALLGAFAVAGAGGAPVEEPGRLYALSMPLGRNFPHGALLVTDESGPDLKLISFADIAATLGLATGSPQDPRAAPPPPPFVAVTPTVETVPVTSYGDAADDPAIWAHPTDPAQSLVIATDKRAGLYVYDMAGQVLQFLPDGRMNNVDLRDGFSLGGQNVTLVTASNRSDRTISVYRLDPVARRLVSVADGPQASGLNDPYGLCMYRSPRSGRIYVFVNGDDTRKRQFELIDAGNGRVRAQFVRELTFGSQTEGCVADDFHGVLYVGEEDVALWRVNAEPDGGQEMTAIARIADNPAIRADIEGVSLYDLGDGRGYIVFSSQGNNSYAVYRREGAQEYLGSFAIIADPEAGIDGASQTDGLDISSANLGPGFEHGALVVQDGRNIMPEERHNYKYVPWAAVARALGLEMR